MHEHMTSRKQRDYALRLHLPQDDPPESGHAVIWLLDSPTTWAPMQQALDAAGGDDVAVVGIGWDRSGAVDQDLRRRDFTQPARHEVPPPRGSADAWHEDGDADAFLAFLTGTLQPHYLDALPLDARRQTLVGHSLSGLFVLQALIASPGCFQRFVAASPSIWWDQARFVEQAGHADWSAARHARVLLSVGSDEQAVGPEKPPEIEGEHEAAMLGEPHMVDNASAVAELLQSNRIDCRFRLFEGESHRSVLAPAMAAALAFARESGDGSG